MTENDIRDAIALAIKSHGTENTLRAVARGLVKAGDEFDPQDRQAIDLEKSANDVDRIASRLRFVD